MTRTLQLAIVFGVFALASVSAQQPPSPAKPVPEAPPGRGTGPTYPTPAPVANPTNDVPTTPAAPQRGVLGPAPNFTGNTTTLETTGYTIGRRVFAAGARNATWHMHTAGQLVFGEAGRGRLQIQGQPIKELGVGDSAYIPGGAFHWHGASPSENFTMMFVTMGQSKTSQGEPVTEDVYLGKSEK
ncbi:MAG TPA: cupin domain-containing protein [Vicinamibacterales bacterium]|nr:cupin domain-containing protein [Vicinamibacterales bacterium]